ncbi:MAG: phosphoribosylformylglycinamidine synthase subunit PurS, partial [Anaerolineales bacterium]|nr:phosphoribosylformylglycinamidine synthase subunit PurS [Anaerolineales bacterium]
MKAYCVTVFWKVDLPDGRAVDLLTQTTRLGIYPTQIHVSDLYFLRGEFSPQDLDRLAKELLCDPVVEDYHWKLIDDPSRATNSHPIIEVGYHPGVTDPVAENLLRRATLLDIGRLDAVATGKRYTFEGNLSDGDLHRIARELLCNQVIQSYTLGPLTPAFVPNAASNVEIEIIPIREADDRELEILSRERVLFLSPEEMRTIRGEFQKLGRDPTDVELETLAQTWSEHCQHKAFKARIHYSNRGGTPRVLPNGSTLAQDGDEEIHGLLDSYLRAATEQLNRPWVRSAFVDNAGIIDYTDDYEVSFKVETHNHPSALEPFGGANTGVGGVIRDVIGVSARPIANTDVLCF